MLPIIRIAATVLAMIAVSTPLEAFSRGMGGFHGGGGGRMGGFGGGAMAGRAAELGGGRFSGDLGGGPLAGDLASRAGGLGGAARLDNLDPTGAGLGPRASNIAAELNARGLGSGAGSGLANRANLRSELSNLEASGKAPTRADVANFLGLPSDNGLHNLSGETQSRASQALDKARAGDGPLSQNLSGETQSRLSQLYDKARAGDLPRQKNLSGETQSRLSQLYDKAKQGDDPFKNRIPGETQSKLSQLYDNIRAGDGPFKNYIPGETQKPLSRLYDDIRAGNHPFRPMSPWIIHNNAVIIRRNFNNYYIFTPGWYRRYPGAWYPPVWVYGNPWLYAPWPTLSVWLGCSGQPMYYDYGTNVVYQNNSIYVNGQDAGTTQQYYQQAQNLAASGSDASSKQWMPLGVFAISDNGQTSANLVLQLAVDKQGAIRGNLTNIKQNSNEVVHGAVNKQTQRAAWTVGEDTKTVFETGIYNLTKDETPVIVHYGDGQTEQLLLVRLESKDQGKSGSAGSKESANP